MSLKFLENRKHFSSLNTSKEQQEFSNLMYRWRIMLEQLILNFISFKVCERHDIN